MSEDRHADFDPKWIEEWKRRAAERAHDRHDVFQDKFNDAAINGGNVALRTAVLINGGAAVAVLAFVGGLVGQGRIPIAQLDAVAGSLMWFASGVAAATLALAFAYFVNYCSGQLTSSRIKTWEHPYLIPGKGTTAWSWATNVFQWCAVVAGMASLTLFILGMLDVRDSIAQLTPPVQ